MRRFLAWVRRHDIIAFPLITFGLGWSFYLPAGLVVAGHPERFAALLVLQTLGAASPLAAGLLIRYARGGRAEVGSGWRSYFRIKGHRWWWWLGAAALVPALAVLAGVLNGSFGDGMQELWARLGWVSVLLLPVILAAQLASSPLLEEYGWRGFWQVRLQHTLPALPAAVAVGLLWGAHHLPIAIALGADPWRTVVGAVGPSVLAAWLLNTGRGSMAGPLLLHAGLNLAMAVLAPDNWWFPATTLAAAALVVLAVGPKDLAPGARVTLAPAAAPEDRVRSPGSLPA